MSKKVGIGYSFSKEKEIEDLKAKIAELEKENKKTKAETSKKEENKKTKAE